MACSLPPVNQSVSSCRWNRANNIHYEHIQIQIFVLFFFFLINATNMIHFHNKNSAMKLKLHFKINCIYCSSTLIKSCVVLLCCHSMCCCYTKLQIKFPKWIIKWIELNWTFPSDFHLWGNLRLRGMKGEWS